MLALTDEQRREIARAIEQSPQCMADAAWGTIVPMVCLAISERLRWTADRPGPGLSQSEALSVTEAMIEAADDVDAMGEEAA